MERFMNCRFRKLFSRIKNRSSAVQIVNCRPMNWRRSRRLITFWRDPMQLPDQPSLILAEIPQGQILILWQPHRQPIVQQPLPRQVLPSTTPSLARSNFDAMPVGSFAGRKIGWLGLGLLAIGLMLGNWGGHQSVAQVEPLIDRSMIQARQPIAMWTT
jgi:hypothetical protein